MFENLTAMEAIKLFAPIIVIQLGLDIYCIVNILRKGVRSLNKAAWIAIVLLVNLVGAICYLLFGRKRWEND